LTLILLLWFGLYLDVKLLARKSAPHVLSWVYDRLYWAGQRMPLGLQGPVTPHEFLQALTKRLEAVRRTPWRERVLDDVQKRLEEITAWYVLSEYSDRQPGENVKMQALEHWKDLRLQMLLMLVVERWDAFQKKLRALGTGSAPPRQNDNGDDDEESTRNS